MSDRTTRPIRLVRYWAAGTCAAVLAAGCTPAGEAGPTPGSGPSDGGGFVGCGPSGEGGGRAADPGGALDTPAPSQPELFADGVISSDAFEWRITFEADGETAYFARSDRFFPQSRQASIMVARWEAGGWAAPEVAPFSGTHSDIDPFLSPDGQTLFFSSIRPVAGTERSDVDLWMVRRDGDGWSEPEHLGDAVNSDRDELYPSVDANGVLYFGSDREGAWDVFCAAPGPDGRYGQAENVGSPVNVSTWDFNPVISPDGTVLVFTALSRAGGAGAGDIWVSEFVDGAWTEPAGVGSLVNTFADEYHPSFSPSLDRLFYVTDGDIYQVAVSALDLPALA